MSQVFRVVLGRLTHYHEAGDQGTSLFIGRPAALACDRLLVRLRGRLVNLAESEIKETYLNIQVLSKTATCEKRSRKS